MLCYMCYCVKHFIYLFIYIFGCVGSSLLCVVVVSESYSLVGTCGLLIAGASLVAEHRL